MARLIISPLAEADIDDARRFTRARFGPAKADEYRGLIGSALKRLAENPEAGRHRPDIAPEAWTLHIGQPGRKARHLFVYRIGDDGSVQIARLLYDAMDLRRHLPSDFER